MYARRCEIAATRVGIRAIDCFETTFDVGDLVSRRKEKKASTTFNIVSTASIMSREGIHFYFPGTKISCRITSQERLRTKVLTFRCMPK